METEIQHKKAQKVQRKYISKSRHEAANLFSTLDIANVDFIYKSTLLDVCCQAGINEKDQRLSFMFNNLKQFQKNDKISLEQFIRITGN